MEKIFWDREQFNEEAARPEIFEVTDRLVDFLNAPKNFAIVDKLVGQETPSQVLGEKLEIFAKRLRDKGIKESSSAEDILRNFEITIFGYVERAKRLEEQKKGKTLSEVEETFIKNNFSALNEYVNLLATHKDFEKAELNDENGFLKGKIKKDDLEDLRMNKVNLVETYKQFFEDKERKLAA